MPISFPSLYLQRLKGKRERAQALQEGLGGAASTAMDALSQLKAALTAEEKQKYERGEAAKKTAREEEQLGFARAAEERAKGREPTVLEKLRGEVESQSFGLEADKAGETRESKKFQRQTLKDYISQAVDSDTPPGQLFVGLPDELKDISAAEVRSAYEDEKRARAEKTAAMTGEEFDRQTRRISATRPPASMIMPTDRFAVTKKGVDEAQKIIGEGQTVLAGANNVRSVLNDPKIKEHTGPLTELENYLTSRVGLQPADAASVSTTVRSFFDDYRRIVTGAAASIPELRGMEQTLPTVDDTLPVALAKLAAFEQAARAKLQVYVDRLESGTTRPDWASGSGSGQTPAPNSSDFKPPAGW